MKVRRPGVVDTLTLDLELIRRVAALLSRSSQRVRSLDTMDLVEQFSTTLPQVARLRLRGEERRTVRGKLRR